MSLHKRGWTRSNEFIIRSFIKNLAVCIILGVLLGACQGVSLPIFPSINEKWAQLKHSFLNLISPASSLSRKSDPTATPSPTPALVNPKISRENAELLSEMHQVIFLRTIQSRSLFGSYVDTLNQGATLEGIYNGLVHSAIYRELELGKKPELKPVFIEHFVDQLIPLLILRKGKVQFGSYQLLPLPQFNPTQEVIEEKYRNHKTWSWEQSISSSSQSAAQSSSQVFSQPSKKELLQFFAGTNPFILKRVIGDEALKLILELNSEPNRLAKWFGEWAFNECKLGVDFGLEQRNRCDEKFHREWATQVSVDRIIWEVLNRLQRVLNQALTASGGLHEKRT